ncbi:unnamed protein product [Polarella glacialis]|uniref:Anaphase-promoting complex subunit 5 n=1 Tax=Polarella glacialis TaxID=89957 RepID=A0A813H618_POLGL|nr:unnamed protein product [Polarella glacialis]
MLGDRSEVAASLILVSEVHMRRHDYEKALQAADEAAELFSSAGDRRNEAGALHLAARANLKLQRPAEALATSRRAQAYLSELGDRAKEVAALGSSSAAQLALGQVDEALAAASQMSEACRREGQNLTTAEALRELAAVHLARLELGETRQVAREALDAAARCDARAGRSQLLECKAGVLEILLQACQQDGDQKGSVQAAQELAECCRQASWPSREADALRSVARGQLAARRPLPALQASGRAMSLFEDCGDRRSSEEMRFLFSRAQELRQTMREAARSARQAWLLYREAGDPSLLFEAAQACHDARHMFDDDRSGVLGLLNSNV